MMVMIRFASLLAAVVISGCALVQPSGQRYVVFFQPSEYELDIPSRGVVTDAAARWRRHPEQHVVVSGYGDPYGSQKAVAEVNNARTHSVMAHLLVSGVPADRITQRDMGSVNFQMDSLESRRVEITVGRP
jgi:outer membrane protein OmpA-like peptidoglycan-associated protein